jgi:hypothetical protein
VDNARQAALGSCREQRRAGFQQEQDPTTADHHNGSRTAKPAKRQQTHDGARSGPDPQELEG